MNIPIQKLPSKYHIYLIDTDILINILYYQNTDQATNNVDDFFKQLVKKFPKNSRFIFCFKSSVMRKRLVDMSLDDFKCNNYLKTSYDTYIENANNYDLPYLRYKNNRERVVLKKEVFIDFVKNYIVYNTLYEYVAYPMETDSIIFSLYGYYSRIKLGLGYTNVCVYSTDKDFVENNIDQIWDYTTKVKGFYSTLAWAWYGDSVDNLPNVNKFLAKDKQIPLRELKEMSIDDTLIEAHKLPYIPAFILEHNFKFMTYSHSIRKLFTPYQGIEYMIEYISFKRNMNNASKYNVTKNKVTVLLADNVYLRLVDIGEVIAPPYFIIYQIVNIIKKHMIDKNITTSITGAYLNTTYGDIEGIPSNNKGISSNTLCKHLLKEYPNSKLFNNKSYDLEFELIK